VLLPKLRWSWEHLFGERGIMSWYAVAHRTLALINVGAGFNYIIVCDRERRVLSLTADACSYRNLYDPFLKRKGLSETATGTGPNLR
jgi:hypothetical protein